MRITLTRSELWGRGPRAASMVVLMLEGELDASSSKQLTEALGRATELSGDELHVDLSCAELTDSAALGALVLAQKAARRRGGDIVLAGVTAKTERILELTGLDRTFRVVRRAGET